MMKRPPFRTGLIAIAMIVMLPTFAWAMKPGDCLVADRSRGLILVDAAGTQQSELTGMFNSGGFVDVTNDALGNIYALTDGAHGAFVVKVDCYTAAMTVVTSGGHLQYPRTIDLAPNGQLYVLETGPAGAVIRVDPVGGQQTVVLSGIIGSTLRVGADGVAYILIANGMTTWRTYRIDLVTGDTVLVSNATFSDPRGLAIDADGRLVVSEYYLAGVSRIDPSTGAITPITSGGQLMTPWGVAVEEAGTLIVADTQGLASCHPASRPPLCHGVLFRIDPVTGFQTKLSQQGIFSDIVGVDIYHGPTTTSVRNSTWGRVKTLYR